MSNWMISPSWSQKNTGVSLVEVRRRGLLSQGRCLMLGLMRSSGSQGYK